MSEKILLLQQIAQVRGLLGCALVEGQTGMVIDHAGQLPAMEQIAEAAVEFWRVHRRLNSYFSDEFGQLENQLCLFGSRVLALSPSPIVPDTVLVCVGLKGHVDWVALRQLSRLR